MPIEDWRPLFAPVDVTDETGEDLQFVAIFFRPLERVLLHVQQQGSDEPEILIGKHPELIEEDGEKFVQFDRWHFGQTYSTERVPERKILKALTGRSRPAKER